jgi:hypothetical protein
VLVSTQGDTRVDTEERLLPNLRKLTRCHIQRACDKAIV